MEFIIGCNYWASNAGAEMWRNFDIDIIDDDLKILSENGVKYLRVFPNWRDFQPVVPVIGAHGNITGYSFENGREPDNEFYIDEQMMGRFSDFLDVCEKYKLSVIVGIVTGWMSGGLFVPPALYGKNVISDHIALYFQQLFIRGFVERFKDRNVISAWDLGNECNAMAEVSTRWEAVHWTASVSNAIRAADPIRPIVSGMHGLGIDGPWQIGDQAMFTDMLTTHPYPFWCEHTKIDGILGFRTTIHATAQSKFYSDIGGKPCFAEEIGTMGPMVCREEKAADFLRVNMLSLWANGAKGIMWWCAFDQTKLESFPYTEQMVERELGMVDEDRNPKPVLKEMKNLSEKFDSFDFNLPEAAIDGVCILPYGQRNHWSVGYMTYTLAKKAGLNLSYACGDNELPKSDLYLLPSVRGYRIMPKNRFDELKKRVYEGADLYISLDDAIFAEFESFAGLKVIDSYKSHETGKAVVDGWEIEFERERNIITEPAGAEIIARDESGNPFISVNRYGKGRVIVVNAPIEANLLEKHNAFDGNTHLIYQKLLGKNKPFEITGVDLAVTLHPENDGFYAVIINHSDTEKPLDVKLEKGYRIDGVCYGCSDKIMAYDACVMKIIKS